MHSTWVQILFGVVSGVFQFILKNVCTPDVSANSVLVLLWVAILRLGHRNMSWY